MRPFMDTAEGTLTDALTLQRQSGWTQHRNNEIGLGVRWGIAPHDAIVRCNGSRRLEAIQLFAEVIGSTERIASVGIASWNCERGRTEADVHEAFERAIALAKSRGV